MHQTKKLEGDSQKKLTIPETSSERPLEHSEIANSKKKFVMLMSVPKTKTIPTKHTTKIWILQ